jgi:hypothetical protein
MLNGRPTTTVVGKFCLAGCEGAAIAPKHVEPSATSQGSSEAERAWALVKDTTSPAALEAFIRRFGDTFYGDLAKARLAELKQQADAVQQVTKKKVDDDARAKEEVERKRVAMLQQDDERKRAEAEAAKNRTETGGVIPSSARVCVPPFIGAPDQIARWLEEGLRQGLSRRNVVLRDCKTSSNNNDYTLQGYVVAAHATNGSKISHVVDLIDNTGKRVPGLQVSRSWPVRMQSILGLC